MEDQPARRLPNADRAFVDQRRITHYLLNLEHSDGWSKAKFFLARQFTVEGWVILRAALMTQGKVNPVTRTIVTQWGLRYTVECQCPTPDGRNPCIRTVWQMQDGVPHLLTAIPV
jgi:filamentous hemagglutinin